MRVYPRKERIGRKNSFLTQNDVRPTTGMIRLREGIERLQRERRAEYERVANIERSDHVHGFRRYEQPRVEDVGEEEEAEAEANVRQMREEAEVIIRQVREEEPKRYSQSHTRSEQERPATQQRGSREEVEEVVVEKEAKAEADVRQMREEAEATIRQAREEELKRYSQGHTRLERRQATHQRGSGEQLAEEQAAELPSVRAGLATEAPLPVTMQDVAELLPWTWQWGKAKAKLYLRESSVGWLVVLGLTILASAWAFSAYAYQFIFGIIFYTVSYVRAASGGDLLVNACNGLRRDRLSFWSMRQSSQIWFQLMRCQGSEAGFDRQGEISETSWGLVRYISDPIGISPGWTLVIIATFMYWGVPWIRTRISNILYRFYDTEQSFWARVVWTVGASCVVTSLAFDSYAWATVICLSLIVGGLVTILFSRFASETTETAWERARASFLIGPIIEAYEKICFWIMNWMMAWQDAMWKNNPRCMHVDACHCFAWYVAKIEEFAKESAGNIFERERDARDLNDKLAAAQKEAEDAKKERDAYQKQFRQAQPMYNGFSTVTPGPDPRMAMWKTAHDEIQNSYDEICTRYKDDTKILNMQIDSLQKQVKYAAGAGTDRDNAQLRLAQAKASIRTLEREKSSLIISEAKLRQALAKERESHSEKCQNEAGCQKQIQILLENVDRLQTHFRENEYLVFQVCTELLGMSREDAQHMSLRSYLSTITQRVLQLQNGRGVDTTDIQVTMMRNEVAREAAYKNRLERELVRLGGNIIDIRVGLDTTRPQDWKTDFLTYEQNNLRIFPIYQRLCQCVHDLEDIFGREGFVLPPWIREPARNDATTHLLPQSQQEVDLQLVKAVILTNPETKTLEALIEKLVVAECQRLFNRGIQLMSILDSSMTVHAHIEGTQAAWKILNEVLHEVLDYIPAVPITADPPELRLSPRKQKKFEIYTAVQQTIQALSRLILWNKRSPPPWTSLEPLNELFNKPFDTPENLAMNLTNQEITILAHRIHQLIDFTDAYNLPGTKTGPPRARLQYDEAYDRRWNEMVIARSFAELVVTHWSVHKAQKEVLVTDPEGRQLVHMDPNPPLLPLDLKKFQTAVGLLPQNKVETTWPDDWTAKLVQDPSTGPMLVFQPPGARDDGKKDNNNNKNRNDSNIDSLGGPTTKEQGREKLKKEWARLDQRITQLYNHVVAHGIKGDIPRPADRVLRVNADPKAMKHDIENFKDQINQLTKKLTGGKKKFLVPPFMDKGGRMQPW